MYDSHNLIEGLTHLGRICKDSELGLRRAVTELHDTPHRNLLLSAAHHRADLALRIQKELRDLGAKTDKKGSLAGFFHRNWMNLRYQLNLHRDDVVLEECLRGEEFALAEYEKMIERKSLQLDPVLEGLFVNMIELRNQLQEIVASKGKVSSQGSPDVSLLHLKN